jgi:NAD+ synthase (glutamine-hydrolysing)
MIVALAQLNFVAGDFEYNTRRILQTIEEARSQGAGLVVFSELSVCGYPPADLLNMDGFVQTCLEQVDRIAASCQGIAAVVGGPSFNPEPRGKRLFNSAFFLSDGKVQHRYDKGLLPTYDVFDEYRYFESATDFHTVPFNGKRIAITVCEDLWDIGPRPMYRHHPMDSLAKESPDLIINISASPFSWNRCGERLATFAENARRYQLPVILVNQIGAHSELIFDGGSSVFNAAGELVERFEPFEEGLRLVDLQKPDDLQKLDDLQKFDDLSAAGRGQADKNALLLDALCFGVKDYFRKTGLKKAILGLSGGLDSALTLVLAEMALGRENVWAVLLPGPFSSDHSVSDAVKLAETLGVRHDTIPINPVVTSLEDSLKAFYGDLPRDIAEENLQARARAVLLMGLSNKFGHMLLNTSNKSEAAVGYGTLYGDMCGGLSVIGDLYKTEVYSLARYINRDREIIPQNTIDKPPSAELRPGQKDSDSLPDYAELDPVLFSYIEMEMHPAEIVAAGHPAEMVSRVVRLVNASEFKRKQAPPVLRVSQKGFGFGRRMPLVAKYPG